MEGRGTGYHRASMLNTQYKLRWADARLTSCDVIRETLILCASLEIRAGAPESTEIADLYYDDPQLTLASNGCSISKRIIQGQGPRVTFKLGASSSQTSALERDDLEIECTDRQFDAMLADGFSSILSAAFKDAWPLQACQWLRHNLTVHTERVSMPLTTGGVHDFRIDDYWFEDTSGTMSQHYWQVENQVCTEIATEEDPAILRLMDSLCRIYGSELHQTSKYLQGMEWLATLPNER